MSNPAHARGICDRCGFEFPLNSLRKEWTGMLVCSRDYDPRHPQDHVKGVPDRQALHNPRPDTEPTYLETNEVTPESL